MGSRQVSSQSNRKKSSVRKSTGTKAKSKKTAVKTSSRRSLAKSKKGKTVEVSISSRSRRTKLVTSSKRAQSVAAKNAASKKKESAKKTVGKATVKKAAAKSSKAKKSTATKVIKKIAQKKSSSVNKVQSKAKSSQKKQVVVKASKPKTPSMPNRKKQTRQSLSSLIPAPTKEILKPFREAAKRTKKLKKDIKKAGKCRGDFLAKQGRKGKKYKIDLRVHTPGSYGFFSTGGIDPAPALVRLARVKGLDMIGVTDYYNVAYIDRIRAHAESTGITVLPGFDMCCRIGTCDSIGAIALFPPTYCAADITKVLNELKVPESAYGMPDYVLEVEFAEVIKCVEKHGGILIPSRVDKTPYCHLAIPDLVERFGFHAFDLVHKDDPGFFRENWPSGGFTFFTFSNANALGQIGNRSVTVKLSAPGFEGLKQLVARRTEVEEVDEAA